MSLVAFLRDPYHATMALLSEISIQAEMFEKEKEMDFQNTNDDEDVQEQGCSTQFACDGSSITVCFDVSQFQPEELDVKMDGRTLIIEGSQGYTGEFGHMQRTFTRKWTLPDDVDISDIQTSVCKKGHLSIHVTKY